MATPHVDQAVQQVQTLISHLYAPERMSPEEAIAFLGDIGDFCDLSIEALHQENPGLE